MPSQCSLWPIQVTKAHGVIVPHQQRNRKTWFRGRCSRRTVPSTRRGGAWISRGRGSPDRTRFSETQSTEYEPFKPDKNIYNLTERMLTAFDQAGGTWAGPTRRGVP